MIKGRDNGIISTVWLCNWLKKSNISQYFPAIRRVAETVVSLRLHPPPYSLVSFLRSTAVSRMFPIVKALQPIVGGTVVQFRTDAD